MVVNGVLRVIMRLIELIDRLLIEILYQILMVYCLLVARLNFYEVCNAINARLLVEVFFILNNLDGLLIIFKNLFVLNI